MNRVHYTIISGIAVILAIGGLGLTNISDTIPQEPVAPEPPFTHNLKNDYGVSIDERDLPSHANIKAVKIEDVSQTKLGDRTLSVLDVRVRDNGYVHYLYGEPSMHVNDDTTTSEFYESGGVIVRTIPLKDQENTKDALANHLREKVSYVNGVVSIVQGNDEIGYRIDLYPNDGTKVTLGADATLSELTQFVKELGIENHGLDLNDYVKENWKLPEEPPINSEDVSPEP